ncbi:MAG: 30S ribosomal protein S9 [Planctomycetes bacterium]|nr:30S ribosomal protein S9 [Planctomycetota bacterium]
MKTSQAEMFLGTGRRKNAVARVRVKPGTGQITINKKSLEKYFPLITEWEMVRAPLVSVNCEKSVDVSASVCGGGITGQAGAVSLGIARALIKFNGDNEAALREKKFMTRDSRQKERKKYGQRGARRRFQFSKR